MSKYPKRQNSNNQKPIPKNPLYVDLGLFGKVNDYGSINGSVLFKKAERAAEGNEDTLASVDLLRTEYERILTERNFPRIARLTYGDPENMKKGFIKRLEGAQNINALESIMKQAAHEGLVYPFNKNGRTQYKHNPEIQDASKKIVDSYYTTLKSLLKKKSKDVKNARGKW